MKNTCETILPLLLRVEHFKKDATGSISLEGGGAERSSNFHRGCRALLSPFAPRKDVLSREQKTTLARPLQSHARDAPKPKHRLGSKGLFPWCSGIRRESAGRRESARQRPFRPRFAARPQLSPGRTRCPAG